MKILLAGPYHGDKLISSWLLIPSNTVVGTCHDSDNGIYSLGLLAFVPPTLPQHIRNRKYIPFQA